MKQTGSILCAAAMALFLSYALMAGIDREAARQQASTQAMCKSYGAAMNEWARQSNLKSLPCEEITSRLVNDDDLPAKRNLSASPRPRRLWPPKKLI